MINLWGNLLTVAMLFGVVVCGSSPPPGGEEKPPRPKSGLSMFTRLPRPGSANPRGVLNALARGMGLSRSNKNGSSNNLSVGDNSNSPPPRSRGALL